MADPKSAADYCRKNGITPHTYSIDHKHIPKWNPLLGTHYPCKHCGNSRIFIAHDAAKAVAS